MRQLNKRNAQKHEQEAFAEKYDILALLYGDPVEVVFAVMARAVKAEDDEGARIAADTLMGYRFPKIKAQELAGNPDNAPVTNIVVNLMPAPKLELPAIAAKRLDIGDLIGR